MTLPNILVYCLLGATQVAATSRSESFAGTERYDPLRRAQLIVRGTVLGVDAQQVLMSAWGMADKGMEQSTMTVTSIRVTVASVLRGELAQQEVTFGAIGGLSPLFEVGHEYVVCAKWRPVGDGGVHVTGRNIGLYIRQGDAWARIVEDTITGSGELLTDEQMLWRIQSTELAYMTRSADVIAHGKIRDTWRTPHTAVNGYVDELVHYTLELGELLKGEAPNGHLEFVIAQPLAYTPDWYRIVPVDIRVGQAWYVFLRRGERGLSPFEGPSSLLPIDGNTLIDDNTAEFPRDVKELDRLVRMESADDR